MNRLYFGDNLQVLGGKDIADESVDLVYLDPPFNSNAIYNQFFSTPTGERSEAQATAFMDTWKWGAQAEREFTELLHGDNTDISELVKALRSVLGDSDMMAYLIMMTRRLVALHRVLRSTGSLYLHCDPTASHYLKSVLDAVFGSENYRTEISWRRQSAHNDAKQGRKQYGNVRDVILFYTKSNKWKWNWQYTPYSEQYVKDFYKFVEAETGRLYRLSDITAPGGAAPEKRNPRYEFLGVTRYWRYSRVTMDSLYKQGRIIQTAPGRVPAYKRYLDEMPGVPLQNDWNDILPAQRAESVGWPTQKPLALLERIIAASSNPGDVVLDPFCGCGTAVIAAEKLKRQWIGIDITQVAIAIITTRLQKAFPGIKLPFVNGSPKDLQDARALADLSKYEFQYWACSLVGAQPYQQKKKGADTGIDGLIYFVEGTAVKRIVVSVKGGENVSAQMVRELRGVVEREGAAIGLFVTLAQPTKAMKDEAVRAGFYNSPIGKSFSKLQLLTIEGLLSGTSEAKYPDAGRGGYALRKKRPQEAVGQGELPLVPEAVSLARYLDSSRATKRPAARVTARRRSAKEGLAKQK